jgi:hypothetical protein
MHIDDALADKILKTMQDTRLFIQSIIDNNGLPVTNIQLTVAEGLLLGHEECLNGISKNGVSR